MRRAFSNSDFSALSFHDVHVHAHGVFLDEREVRLDIDYLVEWHKGKIGQASFKVCPATLVFDNGAVLQTVNSDWFVLSEISRTAQPDGSWDYELRSQTGTAMRVRAQGFRMYLRGEPVSTNHQKLSAAERGPSTMVVPH